MFHTEKNLFQVSEIVSHSKISILYSMYVLSFYSYVLWSRFNNLYLYMTRLYIYMSHDTPWHIKTCFVFIWHTIGSHCHNCVHGKWCHKQWHTIYTVLHGVTTFNCVTTHVWLCHTQCRRDTAGSTYMYSHAGGVAKRGH